MTRLTRGRRRTFSVVVGLTMIGALAIGVSQALADHSHGHAVANVYNDKVNCGGPSKNRVDGTATFDLKGTTLTVSVSMHNAVAGDYDLLLFHGGCNRIGPNVKFKVDASGNGAATLVADVSGAGRSFFINAANNTEEMGNESDTVKL